MFYITIDQLLDSTAGKCVLYSMRMILYSNKILDLFILIEMNQFIIYFIVLGLRPKFLSVSNYICNFKTLGEYFAFATFGQFGFGSCTPGEVKFIILDISFILSRI
eukprot:276063_1